MPRNRIPPACTLALLLGGASAVTSGLTAGGSVAAGPDQASPGATGRQRLREALWTALTADRAPRPAPNGKERAYPGDRTFPRA